MKHYLQNSKIQKKIHGTVLVLTQGASGHNNYAHWLWISYQNKIGIYSMRFKKIDFFFFQNLIIFRNNL